MTHKCVELVVKFIQQVTLILKNFGLLVVLRIIKKSFHLVDIFTKPNRNQKKNLQQFNTKKQNLSKCVRWLIPTLQLNRNLTFLIKNSVACATCLNYSKMTVKYNSNSQMKGGLNSREKETSRSTHKYGLHSIKTWMIASSKSTSQVSAICRQSMVKIRLTQAFLNPKTKKSPRIN